jgi:predicted DNA binding protein
MNNQIRPEGTPTPQTPSASTTASTARFTFSIEGFALAELFERVTDARVECEPTVANPDDHALLIVRTTAREREVDAALRADTGVATFECLDERPDGWAYRITWSGTAQRLIQRLTATEVTVLSMRGQGGRWEVRLLSPDRDGISRVNDILDELSTGAECQRVATLDNEQRNRSQLTDEQREALLTGFERGYYDVPRNITTIELSDELGISHQALSERLRRAHHHLIKSGLVIDEDSCEDIQR